MRKEKLELKALSTQEEFQRREIERQAKIAFEKRREVQELALKELEDKRKQHEEQAKKDEERR